MDYSSWSVPTQTISFLDMNLMIVISVIFVLGFVLVVRYSARVIPAIIGAVAYLLFGFLGTECVCMVFGMIPGIGNFIYSNAVIFSVFRAVVLAAMYHVGRVLTVTLTSKEKYTIGNSMMAGFGNAVGFAVVSGFNYMYSSVMASTINEMGVEALLEGYTAEQAESMLQSINALVTVSPMTYLLLGIGTALDIIAMVILCVFLYGIMMEKLSFKYHWIMIGANAAIILPSTLIECYSVEQCILFTIIKITAVVVLFWGMLYVDGRYLDKAFATANANKYQTTTHLPRMKK